MKSFMELIYPLTQVNLMPALERDSQKIREESLCFASSKENLFKGNNPDCNDTGILLYMKFRTWRPDLTPNSKAV